MDNNLIIQAQNGDKQAFGQLYDDCADQIFRFINMRVNSKQQAEDILQDTFIKAWQAMPRFDNTDGHFLAWLYRIAANAVTDHYRRLYRRPESLSLDEEAEIEVTAPLNLVKEIDNQIDLQLLKGAMSTLPATYRQVLELRFIQDFTVSETAGILNKSNLAVRLLQHRALKQLKTLIQTDAPEYSKI